MQRRVLCTVFNDKYIWGQVDFKVESHTKNVFLNDNLFSFLLWGQRASHCRSINILYLRARHQKAKDHFGQYLKIIDARLKNV